MGKRISESSKKEKRIGAALGCILILLLVGCASVKAPKARIEAISSQIMPSMTISDMANIRPVVYYKSKTLGVEFYETQHLTPVGKRPFVTKQTEAYKDTIRAFPCWFKVRASNGKRWSAWSEPIFID
jgi:hypothetical protein